MDEDDKLKIGIGGVILSVAFLCAIFFITKSIQLFVWDEIPFATLVIAFVVFCIPTWVFTYVTVREYNFITQMEVNKCQKKM